MTTMMNVNLVHSCSRVISQLAYTSKPSMQAIHELNVTYDE